VCDLPTGPQPPGHLGYRRKNHPWVGRRDIPRVGDVIPDEQPIPASCFLRRGGLHQPAGLGIPAQSRDTDPVTHPNHLPESKVTGHNAGHHRHFTDERLGDNVQVAQTTDQWLAWRL
jgi:hypothetical protein